MGVLSNGQKFVRKNTTVCQAALTLMIFPKDIFEKLNFFKKSVKQQREICNITHHTESELTLILSIFLLS